MPEGVLIFGFVETYYDLLTSEDQKIQLLPLPDSRLELFPKSSWDTF
jgi:hypothetical protein